MSVTGKVYASGVFTVTVGSGSVVALPSQICDEVFVTWPTNAAFSNVPLESSLVTVTTSGTANTFTQLASAAADQVVIFNQSTTNVLSVGFSASPGAAVVPLPAAPASAANGSISSFVFNIGFGGNANKLFVASAGSSQVFSYLIRLQPFAQIQIAPSGAAGPNIFPGSTVVVPVPAGPGFTGNANQVLLGLSNAPSGGNFYCIWRRYSI